ncbi:hypothetical protein [Nitratireductor indicus]|uniref:hypothetical protein n=1 Tax=Nitratireductor indicus TaxID=721133 RepID=UPI0015A6EAEF|nr:hypothetical protein [Nitratireductor indicus]MDS1135228.1 hypothetical protein [Nitratireductor indicus]
MENSISSAVTGQMGMRVRHPPVMKSSCAFKKASLIPFMPSWARMSALNSLKSLHFFSGQLSCATTGEGTETKTADAAARSAPEMAS